MQTINVFGNEISKITLGTVQLGLDYGVNNTEGKPSEEKAFEIIKTATKLGITAFDTASDYGTSEKVLGDYFRKNGFKNSTIITKIGIRDKEKLSSLEVEKRLYEEVENSLSRLGYESLPLVLLHNPKNLEDYFSDFERVLRKLQNEKLVKKFGVSIKEFSDLEMVLKSDLYNAIQCPLNVLNVKDANSGALKMLKEKGIAVFIRSVFLQGLLFKDVNTLPSGVLQGAKEPLLKLRKIAEEENLSVAGLAISYIRDLEGVVSLVMGAENEDQVKENASLIGVKKLSSTTREKIYSAFYDIDSKILKPWLWYK